MTMSSAYPRSRTVPPANPNVRDDGDSRSNRASPPSSAFGNVPPPVRSWAAANGSTRPAGMVNGGQPLAYTYSPLEHSTSSSWQQNSNGFADVVLGGESLAPRSLGEIAGGSSSASGDDWGRGELRGEGGSKSQQSKTYRLAVKRTVMSIALSCCFGLGTMVFKSRQSGLEFFAGYLVEQSLS